MITCSKRIDGISFAHRQSKHKGRCSLIHGHDWDFEFEFSATERDECGFVMDFGKLKTLKARLMELDHSLVLSQDDPKLESITEYLRGEEIPNVVVVPDCSCEGLAIWASAVANGIVQRETGGRVSVQRVTVYEGKCNSATWRLE